jgi:hypothetical protein
VPVDLKHPANALLIKYGKRELPTRIEQNPPDDVRQPYLSLGTHPDIVERLWDQLAVSLPEKCDWVLYGRPVLVRPATGIVFAWATGHVYALRLPSDERALALRAGASRLHTFTDGTTLNLDLLGPEWVFGMWFKDEPAWCAAAYDFAQMKN